MNNIIINFKEKKLLFAFAFLILLTLVIGLVGIFQIQGLTRKIEDLGKNNLTLESAVLEMRIKNANYAMGIRNYCYWRLSRYLGAAPMGASANKIFSAGQSFRQQLKLYRQNAYLNQQKVWANQAQAAFDEVFALGKKIIQLVDQEEPGKAAGTVNSLLMSFENRIYKIDEFLDNSMGKSNLEEVRRQMVLAREDKERSIFFLRASLITALIVGSLIALAVYRRRIKERLLRQDMYNRMINVEEDERRRLSNAVHDEMGQDLSALKIYLGLISQELISAGTESKSKVEECRKITSGLIEKSHNIALLLRPPDLDEVGLLESIESLLLESKYLSGIEYIFQKPQGSFKLPAEHSLLIYRIVQELLTNMIKHAKAKNVELKINKGENSLELFYRDDGQGFDYEQDAKKFLRRREDKFRLGLIGLKERVEVLDGLMQINSSRGEGMRVSVILPIQ